MSKPATVTIILGTYERQAMLQAAIESIRKAAAIGGTPGGTPDVLTYEIVVVDGGSTKDHTRAWLAHQEDVVLLGHRGLHGAVEAYNHAFAYAVDRGSPYIAVMNDDARIVEADPGGLQAAVRMLEMDPKVGAVAFAFDLFTTNGSWGHDHVYGLPYVNYGVFRREAGMAAAVVQGDPSGRRWWNPIYHTYAADCELGVWLWKLGWAIKPTTAIRVEDKSYQVEDELRDNNRSRDAARRDTKLFYERWKNESLVREPTALPARPVMTQLRPDEGVRRILVTGGSGFLGKHIRYAIRRHGVNLGYTVVEAASTHDADAKTIVVHNAGRGHGDLRDPTATRLLFDRVRPDVVIHAAATVGGIGANVDAPIAMFEDNMRMGMNVLAECARHPVRRVVLVGTTCSYPGEGPLPFRETKLDAGRPEATNAPYGVAKRALIELADAYRRQHALDVVVAIPANLYGEGDTFDDARSHVIAAMLKKIVAAKVADAPAVTLWGDGSPTRDFLHAEDAARGIVLLAGTSMSAFEAWRPYVVNFGTGLEAAMSTVAHTLTQILGYEGTVVWDGTKPNGQARRALDTTRAKSLGWSPTIALDRGLRRLVAWYLAKIDASQRAVFPAFGEPDHMGDGDGWG